MEKFNLEKHWDDFINDKIIVNCRTEEFANEFLKYCDSKNCKWTGEDKLTDVNHWKSHEKNTFYGGNNKHFWYNDCSQSYYYPQYKLVEFQGIESGKEFRKSCKSPTSKETIEVIYHGKETIVLIKADGRYYKGVVSCHYQDTYDKEEGFKRAYAIAREKYNEFKDYAKSCADLVK